MQCRSAEEYLAFCKAFVTEVAKAVNSPAYGYCLYDEELGQKDHPYTEAYFKTLVDVLFSRCMTRNWETGSRELPERSSSQDDDLNDDGSGKGKATKRDPKEEGSKMTFPKQRGPNEGGTQDSSKKGTAKEGPKEDDLGKSVAKEKARTVIPSRTRPNSEPKSPKPVVQMPPTSPVQAQLPAKEGKGVTKHQVPVRGGPSSKK